jgi:hypothetical protein
LLFIFILFFSPRDHVILHIVRNSARWIQLRLISLTSFHSHHYIAIITLPSIHQFHMNYTHHPNYIHHPHYIFSSSPLLLILVVYNSFFSFKVNDQNHHQNKKKITIQTPTKEKWTIQNIDATFQHDFSTIQTRSIFLISICLQCRNINLGKAIPTRQCACKKRIA